MKLGFTCGAFDLLHPGHLTMLMEAKFKCDYLIVGLQTDPTLDRPAKNKPIQPVFERNLQLNACKFVDEVIVYDTEAELYRLLTILPIDIRFIGVDHRGSLFTGHDLMIPIIFNKRDHNYSSSSKRVIYEKN